MNALRQGILIATLLLAGCAGMPANPSSQVMRAHTTTAAATPAPAMSVLAPPPMSSGMSPQTKPIAAPSTAAAEPKAPAARSTPAATSATSAPVAKSPRRGIASTVVTRTRHTESRRERHSAKLVSAQPVAASTSRLDGRVTLKATRGQRITAGDTAQTLVYFVPATGNVAPKPGAFTVFTHNRAFSPDAMAIPIGSTITFVNQDDVRHNEFSVTPGSAFNLGYQAPGEKTAHVFAHAGLVLVGCLVHRAMELDMLVVPTTFVTLAAANGNFSLRGLPPGPGTLYVWNPRGRLVVQTLTLPAKAPVNAVVSVDKPSQTAFVNVQTQP